MQRKKNIKCAILSSVKDIADTCHQNENETDVMLFLMKQVNVIKQYLMCKHWFLPAENEYFFSSAINKNKLMADYNQLLSCKLPLPCVPILKDNLTDEIVKLN